MEREIKSSVFGFSWAEEVEREEREQEHKAGTGRQEKPNPFGAARPREVVLEEKGVDWRRIDLGLEKDFNPRKENLKGKSLLVAASTSKKESSIGLRYPDKKKSERRKTMSSCLVQHRHDVGLVTPLLGYPSQNRPNLIPQMRGGQHTAIPDRGSGYPHEEHLSMEYLNAYGSKIMHNRQRDIARGVPMSSGKSYNMDRIGYERAYPIEGMCSMQENESRCKRKSYEDGLTVTTGDMRTSWENTEGLRMRNQERKFVDEMAEMQAYGKRRILGDHNMERGILGKKPSDAGMLSQQFYDKGSTLRTASAVKYGALPTVEVMNGSRARRASMGSGSSQNDINKMSRVPATSKPNPCHRRRNGRN